jgi:uncharacterized protein (TIGR00730 family)
MTDIRSIAVFCGSRLGTRPAYQAAAEALGDLLAGSGITLIYGGGRIGLMGVISDRVLAGGGKVVGVIPEFLMKLEVGHSQLTELVRVSTMHERKYTMFDRADAFVILPGGLGTLEEGMEIITWKQLRLHAKPIALLDVDGYWQPLIRLWEQVIAQGFAHDRIRDLFAVVPSVDRLLDALATQGVPDSIVLDSHL